MSRRESILAAAEKLLEHYGVNKTTMSDIAREAGVGVGTVYLEFDSKDAIISAIARQRHDAILQEIEEAASSGRAFEDRIRGFLETRYRIFLRFADAGAHAAELVHCRCDGVEEAWRKFAQRERELLVSILEEGVADGELDVPDPKVTAEAIFKIYATFAPPHLDADERCRTRVLHEVHHLVLKGLLKRR